MADKPLSQHTDDELRRTLQQANLIATEIGREQRRRKTEAQKVRATELTKLAPSLLELVPHHTAPTCSDNEPTHSYSGGCVRCTLLEAKQNDFWDGHYDLDIRVDLRPHAD